MKATDIIEQARKELKDFIVFEAKYIYAKLHNNQYPTWENDEEYVINFEDILEKGLQMAIRLDDLDGFEATAILKSIHITLDDNLFFWEDSVETEEHHYGELKIDELADIANLLEERVNEIINFGTILGEKK